MKLKKKALFFKNCLLHDRRQHQAATQGIPCKLRVYTLSADISWYLHYVQQRSIEEISCFYSCDYRERLNIEIPFNAGMLEAAVLNGKTLLGCTGYIMNEDEIMEIDDGFRPIFFYIQNSGIRRISVQRTASFTKFERNCKTHRLERSRFSGPQPFERIGCQA